MRLFMLDTRVLMSKTHFRSALVDRVSVVWLSVRHIHRLVFLGILSGFRFLFSIGLHDSGHLVRDFEGTLFGLYRNFPYSQVDYVPYMHGTRVFLLFEGFADTPDLVVNWYLTTHDT